MLTKIQELKNVGVFGPDGSGLERLPLSKLTLIYAGNGSGKTTLSAVMHSALLSDYTLISERERVGVEASPTAKLRFGSDLVALKDESWTGTMPGAMVFDEHFVRSNVFVDDGVRSEHRKNLFGLVVGDQGVDLARRRIAYRDSATSALESQKVKKAKVERWVPGIEDFPAFLNLEEEPDVEAQLQREQSRLEEIEAAALTKPKGSLAVCDVVPLRIERVRSILAKNIDDVSSDALNLVREHATELGEGAEEWVARGHRYGDKDSCPYCGQATGGVPLVEAYSQYFNETYNDLRRQVDRMISRPATVFSSSVGVRIANAVESQDAHWAYWSVFLDLPSLPRVEVDPEEVAEGVRSALEASARRKRAAILDAASLLESEQVALANWVALTELLERRNDIVADALQAIGDAPEDPAVERARPVKSRIARLQLVKRRHEHPVKQVCDEYIQLGESRKEDTRKKEDADKRLGEYVKRTFKDYRTSINHYLRRMNAGFQIPPIKPSRRDGGVSWGVQIESTTIPATDASGKRGVRCLRTALSAGDRTALALAFFLARVDSDKSCQDMIVVLDDPMSSLDNFRRRKTIRVIGELVKKTAQVILLSHDLPFLGKVFQGQSKVKADPPKMTLLRLDHADGRSIASVWDIEKDLIGEYERDVDKLVQFAKGKVTDPSDAVRCARPVLEAWLRLAYPSRFSGHQLLRSMLDSAKKQTSASRPIIDPDTYAQLVDMNEYFKEDMHASSEKVDSDEARREIEKVLDLVNPYWRE